MPDPASNRHLVDLKTPLGGLLAFCGALLAAYGALSPSEMYEKSQGININLVWGIVMLVVGGLFLAAHFLKRSRSPRS